MALYTPEYQPTGEVAVINTSRAPSACSFGGHRRPIHVGGFVETGPEAASTTA
ncbi:MAG: hypothetical protein ACLTDR_05620 [Adlercreutzia equolifaciens]